MPLKILGTHATESVAFPICVACRYCQSDELCGVLGESEGDGAVEYRYWVDGRAVVLRVLASSLRLPSHPDAGDGAVTAHEATAVIFRDSWRDCFSW